MDERFTPQERIRKKKDFIDLYQRGRRYRGKYFHLVYHPGSTGFPRLGVVVGKKVGNAVARNKTKRRIRALFRRNKTLFESPLDVILIAKKEIVALSWQELSREFFQAIRRIARKRCLE